MTLMTTTSFFPFFSRPTGSHGRAFYSWGAIIHHHGKIEPTSGRNHMRKSASEFGHFHLSMRCLCCISISDARHAGAVTGFGCGQHRRGTVSFQGQSRMITNKSSRTQGQKGESQPGLGTTACKVRRILFPKRHLHDCFHMLFIVSRVACFPVAEAAEEETEDSHGFFCFGSGPSVSFSTLVVIFPACSEAGSQHRIGTRELSSVRRRVSGPPLAGGGGCLPLRAAAFLCLLFLFFFNSLHRSTLRAGFSLSFELFLVGHGSESPPKKKQGRDGNGCECRSPIISTNREEGRLVLFVSPQTLFQHCTQTQKRLLNKSNKKRDTFFAPPITCAPSQPCPRSICVRSPISMIRRLK
ncbi:hypothetical protein LX32DRAFT_252122 [Colletotrichum zoysiae]|uniref:Uncharacterized protein n=1 Tax=Colletotrichum zoysiae TaxID=1216348 RepID=A0AAD9H4M4_9PEZI|nr:hypothetical protein LX32DRAFT_252122 [Colletotrichum zoysiae]